MNPTQRRTLLRALFIELGLIALAALVYVVVREVTEGTPQRAHENARRLILLEQSIGLHHERSVQSLVLDNDWLRTAANWIYIWGHWPVIACVTIGLWLRRRDTYVRLRNAILVSGVLGFVLFALVPMAPPRLTDFGYVDTVTVWSNSYRFLQPPQYTNIYAAMPSLHFGWDLLVGVALFTSTSVLALRAFGVAMPVAMAFAVVATGNHWILDTIVGLLVVVAGAALSELGRLLLQRRRARAVARARATARAERSSTGGMDRGRVPALRAPSD